MFQVETGKIWGVVEGLVEWVEWDIVSQCPLSWGGVLTVYVHLGWSLLLLPLLHSLVWPVLYQWL